MEQQENEPNRITNKELFERQKKMLLTFAEKGAISEATVSRKSGFCPRRCTWIPQNNNHIV